MEFLGDIRCCIFLVLIVAAVALAVGIYAVTLQEQHDDFAHEVRFSCQTIVTNYSVLSIFVLTLHLLSLAQFESLAYQVLDYSDGRIHTLFQELERISYTTTTFIKEEHSKVVSSNQNVLTGDSLFYPAGFVTIPDSEVLLGRARDVVGADFIAYAPMIQSQEEAQLWTEYSKENVGWLKEAYEVYNSGNNGLSYDVPSQRIRFLQQIDDETPVNFDIWRFEIYDQEEGSIDIDPLTCPMWMPKQNRPWNEDEKSAFLIASAIEAGRILSYIPEPVTSFNETFMSPIWTSSPPSIYGRTNYVNWNAQSDPTFHYTTQVANKIQSTSFQDVCSPTAPWYDASLFPDERYTVFATPVYDKFEADEAVSQIVGHYLAVVSWNVLFRNIIHSGSYPVHIVMRNDCGRTFTLQLEYGKDAIMLNNTGDSHTDREDFNDMKVEKPFATFANGDGETMDDRLCSFTISVYPTVEMENAYKTNEPVQYAMVVLAVFVITSLAFIFFDCVQQRRQQQIMNTARRQNQLVSSLFPTQIQNQLMEEYEMKEALSKREKKYNKSGSAGLRSFLDDRSTHSSGSLHQITSTKPIADLFPETTIMFADIVGTY
jgi:hypothetical protein